MQVARGTQRRGRWAGVSVHDWECAYMTIRLQSKMTLRRLSLFDLPFAEERKRKATVIKVLIVSVMKASGAQKFRSCFLRRKAGADRPVRNTSFPNLR